MASDNWTQHDLRIGSISSDQIKTDVGLGIFPAEAAHGGADGYIPFPLNPSPISPLSTGNSYGHCSILSSPVVHDLNMMTDTVEFNPAQDMNNKNDAPFLDYYQIPTFPVTGMNVTTTSGCQTPGNLMTDYHCMNRASHLDSAVGAMNNRNFINASSNDVRNFHIIDLHEETKNNSNQLTDINRTVTNLVPEIPHKLDIVQRADDNQVRVNPLQLDFVNKLDGRFLSLGYQSNSSFDIQSDACGMNASKVTASSFPSYGQSANSSLNNLEYSLSGFQNNMDSIMTQEQAGNLPLFNNDHDIWPATASGFDGSTIPVFPGRETNTHHFIPTPRSRTSGSGNEMHSTFSSHGNYRGCGANTGIHSDISGNRLGLPEPMQRGMQRLPFNSSVLRSNHQNASDPMLISYLKPNLGLPLFGGITGDSGLQDQSGEPGLVLGSTTNTNNVAQTVEGDVAYKSHIVHPSRQVDQANVASYAEAGKGHDFEKGTLQLASQGATKRVKGELSHTSTTGSRESLKRRLPLPPPALTQDQRRKIMPQTSTYPFSPHLLQNALGQVGKLMPSFFNRSNPSQIPTAAVKGPAARGSTKNQTAFPAAARTIGAPSSTSRTSMHPSVSAETSISPALTSVASSASQEISLAYPSATMTSPASFVNIPPIPVIANEGPIFSSPTISAASATGRITATSGFAGIPVAFSSSKRVVPETSSPSHIPAPVTVSRKTLLPRTSSARTAPAVSSLRRSLPGLAALAKVSPALRAPPGPASLPHIKWKGFEMPQLSGVKCFLCKRDLSYTPEGPISVPAIPPVVAILPCGHNFHDHCLLLITPADLSKNPPCIPCAMSEK